MDGQSYNVEKCVCGGTGKSRRFDNDLNKWVPSNVNCKYCNGTGERKFVVYIRGTDFLKRKVYI